jgi:hypothetical protein
VNSRAFQRYSIRLTLLAGVLTSTGSWPNILPNGESSPWSVRTSWYCGIILSLFSILTAADQTVRLHRLSSHRDGLNNIRKMLSKTNGERSHSSKTGRRAPSLLQIITWQMPVMFLTSATLCMIIGMFLHVWSATTHLHQPFLWDDNTKVLFLFLKACIVRMSDQNTTGCDYVHLRRHHCYRALFRWPGLTILAAPALMVSSLTA